LKLWNPSQQAVTVVNSGDDKTVANTVLKTWINQMHISALMLAVQQKVKK